VEAAWAASRARGTYLQSQFRHLAYPRGKGTKKAIVAVAHSILIAAWHILKKNVPYQDLGPEHLRRADPEKSNATSSQNWKPSAIESPWRKKPPRDDKTF